LGKYAFPLSPAEMLTTRSSGPPRAQLTAKVMFGTVGAIKELRDKEQQQQQRQATRAGERRN